MKNPLACLLPLCLIALSCQHQTSIEKNTCLETFFFQKVDSLRRYSPQQAIDEDFITLSAFLIELTNHAPSVEIKTVSCFFNSPDTVIYTTKNYAMDAMVWKKWLDTHKRELSYYYADSVYQAVRKVVADRKYQPTKEGTNSIEVQSTAIIDTALLKGAYGIDDLGNAIFSINKNTFYYPDSNMSYDYQLKGDTILLYQDNELIERILIKGINDEHLVLYYMDYQTIDTLIKRGPDTGNEVVEYNETKEAFDLFLAKFSFDTLYQLKHIQFPIETKSIDIEDYSELVHVSREQWKHLDLSYDENIANRKVDAYEQVIEVYSDSCIVSFKGIDNGIWIDHVFERIDNEWILVRLIDTSY